MSNMKLRELIRSIRMCKTAAEERAVVSKECALIRNSFREEQGELRSRNIAKLLFINLLGYSTPFAQVECLKLIASSKYSDKRIGYLGLTNLLNEDSEVLMMVTNSIKMDLNHSHNHYIVGLALTAIGEISTPEMCRELFPEVKKLITGSNANIKKKATLVAVRIIKRCPEMTEDFSKVIDHLLQDKSHGNMLATLALLKEILITEPKYIKKFRKIVPTLVKTLRGLLVSGYAPDYDVSGITDPFLQVGIMQVLRLFGENNVEASEEMSDVLAHLATNTESSKSIGNAILYECVKTILSIQSNQGLRVLAVNILGRFLLNRENNIKYVALQTLKSVVNIDFNAVQRHKATILECVKDHDVSIKKEALSLLYQIINGTNVKSIVKELVNVLLIADSDFKEDLCSKICLAVEKYGPNRKWHIDTIIKVLTLAGNHVKEEFISNLIHLISAAQELQAYSVHRTYFSLKENLHQEGLVILGMWLIGEFGEHLLNGEVMASDESPITLTEDEICDIIELILENVKISSKIKEYALTTLLKLSVKVKDIKERIISLIDTQTSSPYLEVQQRACEYNQILDSKWDTYRRGILDPIPISKKGAQMAEEGGKEEGYEEEEPDEEKGKIEVKPKKIEPKQVTQSPDVFEMISGGKTQETVQIEKVQDPGLATLNELQDIFSNLDLGGPVQGDILQPSSLEPQPLIPSQTSETTPQQNILNLFGPSTTSGPTSSVPMAVPMGGDLFGDFQGEEKKNWLEGFSDNNMKIEFEYSNDLSKPSETKIVAYFSNKLFSPISNINMLVAVQKYLTLQLMPITSPNIEANATHGSTQTLIITNSLKGQKAIVLKLKITYFIQQQQITETKIVTFPMDA